MNARPPRVSRLILPAIAVVFAATALSLTPLTVLADYSSTVDQAIPAGTFHEYLIPLQATETLRIDLNVQTGPLLGFYFMNQTQFDQFNASWPDVGSPDFVQELSATNAPSIHKSANVPSSGFFHLVIANADPSQAARVVGTIKTTTQFPTSLVTMAIVLVVVGVPAAIIIAVLVRRSVRSQLTQYSPPGRPTPPGQTHQHAPQRPVLQQEMGTCPKCGSQLPRGATACGNCGARL